MPNIFSTCYEIELRCDRLKHSFQRRDPLSKELPLSSYAHLMCTILGFSSNRFQHGHTPGCSETKLHPLLDTRDFIHDLIVAPRDPVKYDPAQRFVCHFVLRKLGTIEVLDHHRMAHIKPRDPPTGKRCTVQLST